MKTPGYARTLPCVCPCGFDGRNPPGWIEMVSAPEREEVLIWVVEQVAEDMGYHSREALQDLAGVVVRTVIAEPGGQRLDAPTANVLLEGTGNRPNESSHASMTRAA